VLLRGGRSVLVGRNVEGAPEAIVCYYTLCLVLFVLDPEGGGRGKPKTVAPRIIFSEVGSPFFRREALITVQMIGSQLPDTTHDPQI